jgi:hypothetical protein
MDIRVNDDTIPKRTINMKLKNNMLGKSHMEGRYKTGDRLGCQATHTKVETIKKLATHSASLSQNFGGQKNVNYAMQALELSPLRQ